MLMLSRRAGEVIRIGDDIWVTIVAVDGAQVRVGVVAPKQIRVDREEVRERRDAERWAKGGGGA
jgi:carbon storage regulator